MKISLNWLNDYIKTTKDADQLAEKLTMAGLEVEAVHTVNGDSIFEIEVTPNRVDCLNVLGIARELSAILNKNKKDPKIRPVKYPVRKCPISIEDFKGCERYVGTVIENIKVEPSPAFIKKRLESIGMRTISNIVDITNFVLMETGQPLHAFDLDKLVGGKIIVRRARKGERIVTIDEIERILDESVLVIADAARPVAIAGIMGGKDTEVNASTKNILLESAYFDPVLIRRTSRKLGLSSDSSYRFERGINKEEIKKSAERAVSLMLEFAGGRPTQHADIARKKKGGKKSVIGVSPDTINGYLGSNIKGARIKSILEKLDFKVSSRGHGGLKVAVPSHRPDITSEVDIIEEVARVEGYDKLPRSLPSVRITKIRSAENRFLRLKLKFSLMAQGFNEIVTYSTTNQEDLNKSKQGHMFATKITNPLSADQEYMRPSMLPAMLNALSFNINRDQRDLRLFETGKIYIKEDEIETLSLAMTGRAYEDWRSGESRSIDFYDIKGVLERVVASYAGDTKISFVPFHETALDRREAAQVLLDGENIGYIGRLEEDVLRNFDIKSVSAYFGQINLEDIYKKSALFARYRPVSAYPSVIRDISLSIGKNIEYKKLTETIQEAGSDFLVDIQFKEDYTDIVKDKISEGHRGILISLVYQSADRTLQEDEVNNDHQRILKRIVENLQAAIR